MTVAAYVMHLVISVDVVDTDVAELQDETDSVDKNDGGVRLDDTVGCPQ